MAKSTHGNPARTAPAFAERFWAKVNKDGPTVRPDLGCCWIWTGKITNVGYGEVTQGGKSYVASRRSWMYANGDIPSGLFVLHHCDNRPCVRPDHLFLGTHTDNMRDMVTKGRARPKYTHCAKGHLLDDDNVYISNRGGRSCKTCQRAKVVAYHAARRAARAARKTEQAT